MAVQMRNAVVSEPPSNRNLALSMHVLLAPVRRDLAARRPEQADRVVLWTVTPRADGIEQERVESSSRLDGRRPRRPGPRRTSAARRGPPPSSPSPPRACRRRRSGRPRTRAMTAIGSSRARSSYSSKRPSGPPGRRCAPRRAAGPRVMASGAIGSGRQACDSDRWRVSCSRARRASGSRAARRSPRRPAACPSAPRTGPRAARRTCSRRATARATRSSLRPSTTGPTAAHRLVGGVRVDVAQVAQRDRARAAAGRCASVVTRPPLRCRGAERRSRLGAGQVAGASRSCGD